MKKEKVQFKSGFFEGVVAVLAAAPVRLFTPSFNHENQRNNSQTLCNRSKNDPLFYSVHNSCALLANQIAKNNATIAEEKCTVNSNGGFTSENAGRINILANHAAERSVNSPDNTNNAFFSHKRFISRNYSKVLDGLVSIELLQKLRRAMVILLLVAIELTSMPFSYIYAQELQDTATSSAKTEDASLPPLSLTPTPSISSDSASLAELPNTKEQKEVLSSQTPFESETVQKTLETLKTTPAPTSAKVKLFAKLRRLAKKHFKARERILFTIENPDHDSINIKLLDASGNETSLLIEQENSYSKTQVTLAQSYAFKPGKYELVVENSAGEVMKQDFTWGVLAINTNKSMYLPNETAKLAMAVLDEKGAMVCDAKVKLKIQSSNLKTTTQNSKVDELSTENGKIKVNPECRTKDLVLKPDYEAEYQVGEAGVYEVMLTAETKNGSYTIRDSFEVRDRVPFALEREAATRIYPPKAYPVTMHIAANEDFEGTITETVPESFAIAHYSDIILSTSEGSPTGKDSSPLAQNDKVIPYDKVETVSQPKNTDVLGISTGLGLPFEGEYAVTLGFSEHPDDPLLSKKYEQYGVIAHDGIDFDLPSGTPVLAVDDGTVALAKEDHDYGTTIVLQHEWGKSYYGHLSKLEVEEGQKVLKGAKIGLSGSTGLSTASHLHFGIKPNTHDKDNGYFGKVDPAPALGLAKDVILSTSSVTLSENEGSQSKDSSASPQNDKEKVQNDKNGARNDKTEVLGVSTQNEQVKVLSWNVKMKKGEELTLGYKFKAPNKSPQFYTVGPLRFVSASVILNEAQRSEGSPANVGTSNKLRDSSASPQNDRRGEILFQEARVWQIAADVVDNGPKVIASILRSTHSFSTEQVGGSSAHVLIITNPGTHANYKYQFLTGGLRLFIDRKGGLGWQQLISQVQTAPEYMKQQGADGNFVWRSYGLSINTTGANVLQGFDRQNQADGSVKLIRTYSTTEEGVAETLTEEWLIPKTTEDLASKGPKATYSMTKNRGIVTVKGVQEGTWRMRWALSGIAGITADNSDIKDSKGWPTRRKSYSNKEFSIDVNDFDNLFDTPQFSFSEIGTNNKAEILFFKNGTTGNRIVDPTVVTSNIASAWKHNKQRNVFYNGTNFFVFYDKGSTSLFAKGASTVADLATATEQTVLSAEIVANNEWNIYMVNDTKFDIVYSPVVDTMRMRTCTISGTTISCVAASADSTPVRSDLFFGIARTPSADRVWILTDEEVLSADQTGDSNNITSWTKEDTIANSSDQNELIPYGSSDKVLVIMLNNPGGTGSDGFFFTTCLQTDTACPAEVRWVQVNNVGSAFAGNGMRVSDTDFRYIYLTAAGVLTEGKYDGVGNASTDWTASFATGDTDTGQKNPSLFYDRVGDVEYTFYADDDGDADTVDEIYRHTKASATTSWGTATRVDNSEADANSLPVTQMHEPPNGGRTTPRELTWCYRNANAAQFDVVCGNLNLATAGPTNDQLLRHGRWFNTSGAIQPFTF